MLAACSGGAGGQSPIPRAAAPSSGQRATATLTVHWTATSTSAAARRPKTISPSAASIVSSVNGNVVNITNRYGSATSQITLDAPVGTDAFTFKIFDQTGGVGNLLGQSSVTKAIIAGELNTLSAAIEAVCAQTVVTGATSPSNEFATYTYAQPSPGQVGTASIASAEIVGAGKGQLFVSAADADGNLILAPGGVPTMSTAPDSTISPASTGPTSVIYTGNSTARGAQTTVNVAAPGCPSRSFVATSSSAIYVLQNGYIYAYDRYGDNVGTTAAPPGTLVGTNGPDPVFYDPSTGNVTETDPDFGSPVVRIHARAGMTLFAYDAARQALISVLPGATTSTVYADYGTGASKQVPVSLNVAMVTAGQPMVYGGGAPVYLVGDGSKIVAIDPTAFTASAPITAPYAYGLLAEAGYGALFVVNTASPYLTEYFISGGGAVALCCSFASSGFTAPVTRAFVEDMEDESLTGRDGRRHDSARQQRSYTFPGWLFADRLWSRKPARCLVSGRDALLSGVSRNEEERDGAAAPPRSCSCGLGD